MGRWLHAPGSDCKILIGDDIAVRLLPSITVGSKSIVTSSR